MDDVARLLGAPRRRGVAAAVTPRQIRLARQRLAAAIEHLTAVMFDQAD